MWQLSIEDGTAGREFEHRRMFTFTGPKQAGGRGPRPADRSVEGSSALRNTTAESSGIGTRSRYGDTALTGETDKRKTERTTLAVPPRHHFAGQEGWPWHACAQPTMDVSTITGQFLSSMSAIAPRMSQSKWSCVSSGTSLGPPLRNISSILSIL